MKELIPQGYNYHVIDEMMDYNSVKEIKSLLKPKPRAGKSVTGFMWGLIMSQFENMTNTIILKRKALIYRQQDRKKIAWSCEARIY